MVESVAEPTLPPADEIVRIARISREQLAECLRRLQAPGEPYSATIESIAKRLTHAVGALFEVEVARADEQAVARSVAQAVTHLGQALHRLRELAEISGGARLEASKIVARVLAILYPIADAIAALEQHSSDWSPPAIPLRRRVLTSPGAQQAPRPVTERRAKLRVALEATVGLESESNFYTGFTEDLSDGGIFIATYELLPVGTAVSVSFGLPGGRVINAAGVVRWVREATVAEDEPEQPPGIGVAFEQIDATDLEAVREFLRLRSAIFHTA